MAKKKLKIKYKNGIETRRRANTTKKKRANKLKIEQEIGHCKSDREREEWEALHIAGLPRKIVNVRKINEWKRQSACCDNP